MQTQPKKKFNYLHEAAMEFGIIPYGTIPTNCDSDLVLMLQIVYAMQGKPYNIVGASMKKIFDELSRMRGVERPCVNISNHFLSDDILDYYNNHYCLK